MAVKPLRCPHCGGVIETFDETMKKGFCPFCDKLIEDVQERQAEMIGYVIPISNMEGKPRKRVRRTLRLITAILLVIVTFIMFVLVSDFDSCYFSWIELLQCQWIPYSLLFIIDLGFFVWNVIGFIIDIRLSSKKLFPIISLAFSGLILIGILLVGAESNRRYNIFWSPEGQLIETGMSKEDAQSVLRDFEKFGLYDFSRERDYVRNGDLNFSVRYYEETDWYHISTMDFTMHYSIPKEVAYSFKVSNGHVTDIRGINDYYFENLESKNMYIVKDGALTNNSLGKRHLIYEYQNSSYRQWGGSKIASQLKSPSSAEFNWNPVPVFDEHNDTLSVYGTVDAQNSFGGMMREKFIIIMEPYTDEEIETMDIEECITCKMALNYPLN